MIFYAFERRFAHENRITHQHEKENEDCQKVHLLTISYISKSGGEIMRKRFLTFVLSFVLILTTGFFVGQGGQAKAANEGSTITRAEWLHNLAETFEMTVEDENYPDNYFSDVDSSHEYYYDILLAVQFGVVNAEAGDPVYPDEPTTRAFASETLNYCLGYQLDEGSSYTFSDSSTVENKDAAQIAVNRRWFSLVNGAFSPDTNVTAAEVSTMLEDAKAVWTSTDVDVNHNNTYSFADGIIDITQATGTYILDDGRIYISECPENIVAGNQFAVELNGIPCVYLAANVEKEGADLIVTGTEVDHDKAYDSIDIQGTVDAGALQIGEAAEGLKAEYVESVENVASPSSLNDRARGSIDLNKKTKLSVSGKHTLGDGQSVSVKAEMKNAKIDYAVSLTGETFVKLHGNANINVSFSFDTMKAIGMDEITLVPAQVPGIGGLDLIMELSAGGKFTGQTKGYMAVGLSYSRGNGMRIIKNFNASSFNFTCEANASAGLKVRLGITGKLLPFNGYVYVAAGGKAVLKHTSYQSGDPKSCSTFAAYLYASAGASASLKLGSNTGVLDKEYEIYGEKNSPLRVYHHYEDGMEVMGCSRGNDYKYYTKAGSNLWGSRWTGANGVYGYDSGGNSIAMYTYSVDSNGNATITKYNGNAAYVYIPEQIDGYTVTMIGENAFKSKGLREVVIPDSVLRIGKSAFEKCTNLRSIDLSSKLKTIDSRAFYECGSLTGIDMPDTVTSIGTYTFYNCTSLTDVKLSELILEIPSRAFANCASLNTVELPDAITSISIYAFHNCTALESVKLPKGLTNLGSRAFMNCSSLSHAWIPKKLNSCGFYEYEGAFPAYGGPFTGCTNLTDIEFESGTTKIPQALLYSCSGIVEITIPDTVTSIGMYGLASCSNLKTVKGMQSVTSIGTFAFQGDTKLENIELPRRLESINAGAFRNCDSLQELTVPKSLSYVGWDYSIVGVGVGKAGVFAGNTLKEIYFEEGCTSVPSRLCIGATSLEHIHFSQSMERIGEYSFSGCSALQEIEFTDNIYDIDNYAFNCCVSVSALKLNNGLQYIEEGAFYDCESISSVTLPDTVISLGDGAFWNCMTMENILISRNLKSIGNTAFQCCYALNDVVIPDNITSIGNNCFRFCTSLSDINIPYGMDSIGSAAFEGCTALAEITIPDSVTYIGSSCFSGCEILENVNLGLGISTIPSSAFQNCAELKKIIIPRYCETIGANAFKENVNLSEVTIPANVNSISNNAFSYPSKITIKGINGSYAESFANSDEYTFVPIDIKSTKLNFYQDELNFSRLRESKVLPLSILPLDSTSVITYISEDEKVAIAKNGVVTSQGYGTTKITVTSDNGLEDVITVNVIGTVGDACQHTSTEIKNAKTANCTQAGYTGDTVCKDCGKVIKKGKSINAVGHSKVTSTAKATVNRSGSIVTKCNVCGTVISHTAIPYPKTITLSKTSVTYSGKVQKPAIMVKGSDGKKISSSNYTLTYSSDCKSVGKHTVKITFKGNYDGSASKSFTIAPKGTNISKLSAVSKGFTAKWKKQKKQTTGYEIQYSTSSKFSKAKKLVISKNSVTSKKITKLKKKKKYYVRIRTYKTVNNVKYYSAWSKTKLVMTKK